MKKLVLSGIIIALGGCASPDYNYEPTTTNISEPPLDIVNIAYVGDTMLKLGNITEHDALYLPKKASITWAYDLMPGYYSKKGSDSNTETYLPSKGENGGSVDKAFLADPWKAVMAYKDKPSICIITIFNAMVCTSADFKRVKRPQLSDNSFQQTLIYNGKAGNKIDISYREISNNTSQTAFNNNVEYDLKTSHTIGYKGARIEVLQATNELIKYRVIRNFTKSNAK